MKNSSMQGQVAAVTGGSRGIGAAIARELARLGFRVAILARNSAALESTAASIQNEGGTCLPVHCELTSESDVQRVAADIARKLGVPSVLVNCAGIGILGRRLLDCTTEDWETVMNVNLRGVFFAVRAFAPGMIAQHGGHIINISSLAGKNPLPGGAIYAASKWGLNGLTVSLAEELREENVRVSLISPGSVSTEFSGHAGKSSDRMLIPEDVAQAVALLVTQRPQAFISEIVMRPARKP